MKPRNSRSVPPEQEEYEKNYINIIFDDVDRKDFVRISMVGLIDHLRERGLNYGNMAHLFGTCPAMPGQYYRGEAKTFGIKVGASVLRRIRINGKPVVLDQWQDPDHIIENYKIFFSGFAFGDGKLHDVGLNGSEHEVYHA